MAVLTAGSSAILGTLTRLLTPLAVTLGAYTFYKLVKFVWGEYIVNPLKEFPGPPSPSWLYGNVRQIWDAENSVLHEKWVEEYGSTIKYKAFLGVRRLAISEVGLRFDKLIKLTRLYTMDMKALNHVLMNTQVYQKPEQSRFFLSRVLGDGMDSTPW